MTSPTSSTTDDETFAAAVIAYDAAEGTEFVSWWGGNASYGGRWSDGSKPGVASEVIKAWSAAPFLTLLAGAKLYTGTTYKAAPPAGHHTILAQLASGHVEQLAWGDLVGQTIQVIDLTAPAKPPRLRRPSSSQNKRPEITPGRSLTPP